jgi:hypothetical protein
MNKLNFVLSFSVAILVAGCSGSDVPQSQSGFESRHRWAVKDYSNADNELQYKAIWEKREKGICKEFPTVAFTDWKGVVKKIGKNYLDTQESANIDIRISERKAYFLFTTAAINLKTLVGSVADSSAVIRLGMNPNTSIVKGTPLYDQVMTLKEGDEVQVSGNFMRDTVEGACFYELSISSNGKIRWPEYVVSFSSIKKVNQ